MYILNIRVLVDCTSCLDNFCPMGAWSSTSLKRLFAKTWIEFKDDPDWLDREWPCCFYISISP